ncbi:hypothetical protein KA005_25190, partial [bacterium]|nr:hypothetical protein [bacterium]
QDELAKYKVNKGRIVQAIEAKQDPDGDTLKNDREIFWGTNPKHSDTDQDSYKDGNFGDKHEVNFWTTNGGFTVVKIRQKIASRDADGDTLIDGWENYHGLLPSVSTGMHGRYGDPDDDDFDNYREYAFDTDPRNRDTDDDGLNDGHEVDIYGTNPHWQDSDGDNVIDGNEVLLGADPNSYDDLGLPEDLAYNRRWKTLGGWGVSAAYLLGGNYERWVDLDDLWLRTEDAIVRSEYTRWECAGFSAGIGISFSYGVMFVKVTEDENGDGDFDIDDNPDLTPSLGATVFFVGVFSSNDFSSFGGWASVGYGFTVDNSWQITKEQRSISELGVDPDSEAPDIGYRLYIQNHIG